MFLVFFRPHNTTFIKPFYSPNTRIKCNPLYCVQLSSVAELNWVHLASICLIGSEIKQFSVVFCLIAKLNPQIRFDKVWLRLISKHLIDYPGKFVSKEIKTLLALKNILTGPMAGVVKRVHRRGGVQIKKFKETKALYDFPLSFINSDNKKKCFCSCVYHVLIIS